MSYKRLVKFGISLWIMVFVIFSIIMFLPVLKDRIFAQHIVLWIILIPVILYLAKWYFEKETPTIKSGLLLGLSAIVVSLVLDLLITVPLFVAVDMSYWEGLKKFFTDWYLHVGLIEVVLLCLLAGAEFDKLNLLNNKV